MNITDISKKFNKSNYELFALLCDEDVGGDDVAVLSSVLAIDIDALDEFLSTFPNIEYISGINYAKYYLAGRTPLTFEGERHPSGNDPSIRYYVHNKRMYFDSKNAMVKLLLMWKRSGDGGDW